MTLPRSSQIVTHRGFYHENKGVAKIGGRFNVGAGPGFAVTQYGTGFTASRTNVGIYLITLAQPYTRLYSAHATCMAAANNVDRYAQVSTWTPGATPTLQIYTKTAAAQNEVGVNDAVYFELTVGSEWLDAGGVPRTNDLGFYHQENTPVKVSGAFAVAGAAIGALTGEGFAVTYTGAGDFLITFVDGYSRLLSAHVYPDVAGAATDLYGQVGAFTAGGAGACTLQVRCKAVAGNADPAICYFEATMYGEALD